MPKTYEKAGKDVIEVMNQALNTWHPLLIEADVHVGVIMVGPDRDEESGEIKGPALTLAGMACAAKVAKVSRKQRVNIKYDAIIEIDEHLWESYSDAQRLALMDHELTHIEVKEGKDGEKFKLDDDGRPALRLRKDDWLLTGFECVIRRHGDAAIEYQTAAATWTRCDQALFEFMRGNQEEAANDKPAKSSKKQAAAAVA